MNQEEAADGLGVESTSPNSATSRVLIKESAILSSWRPAALRRYLIGARTFVTFPVWAGAN
jgi:hypothetical protein